MRGYVKRALSAEISRKLKNNPVVAILGPRQCGKTTLAKTLREIHKGFLYLDLEKPSDLAKLRDPEAYFNLYGDKRICLDEIQRVPEIFPVIRSDVDEKDRNGRFLILGSASPELLRQSSESLAGRIAFVWLTPFMLNEITSKHKRGGLDKLWLRGGFPRSFLAKSNQESYEWREDFIRTFVERDIVSLGLRHPPAQLQRLWTMCAHITGQVLNLSQLGNSLGVSHHTVRSYIDTLELCFMIRTLKSYSRNVKKRLVKSPKIYVRDTGILHTLLGLSTMNNLLGHPVYGGSWEAFVVEQILSTAPNMHAWFYRTEKGNEADLVLEKGGKRFVVECKASTSPQAGKGFHVVLKDLKPAQSWIVSPVKETYPVGKNIWVTPVQNLLEKIKNL
jgi:predicted AAA+ superfamily ATPase